MLATMHGVQDIAEPWAAFMARCLIDGSLGFAVVFVTWLALRRWVPARLGYGLFLLVLAMLLVPVALPTPVWWAAVAPSSWLDRAGGLLSPAAPPPAWREAAIGGAAPAVDLGAASSWQSWMFLSWLAISGLLLSRFLQQQRRMTRLVGAARPATEGELPLPPDVLCRLAGVDRPVRWLVTEDVETPAAGGLRDHHVLLPAGLLPQLAARPLTFVLLHELAHIRRGDLRVALLQRLAQIAFFFHPAVWLANRIIDEQREFACDEEAIVASRACPKECGAGFLSVVEWALAHHGGVPAALAMFDSKSAIRRRLMRILDHQGKQSRWATALTTAILAVTTLFVLPSARVAAESVVPSTALALQDPEVKGAPQDPQKLQRLQRELAELRRQQRELQKQIERAAEQIGDETDANPLRSSRTYTVVRSARTRQEGGSGPSQYVLRVPQESKSKKVVEVRPDCKTIVVREGEKKRLEIAPKVIELEELGQVLRLEVRSDGGIVEVKPVIEAKKAVRALGAVKPLTYSYRVMRPLVSGVKSAPSRSLYSVELEKKAPKHKRSIY